MNRMTSKRVAMTAAVGLAVLLALSLMALSAGAQLGSSRPRTDTRTHDTPKPHERDEMVQPGHDGRGQSEADEAEEDAEGYDGGGRGGDGDRAGGFDRDDGIRGLGGLGPCFDHLNLSSDQRSRIEDLRLAARRDVVRARGDLAKARADLLALMLDPKSQRAEIERAADGLQRTRSAMQDRVVRARLDVRDVLTVDQRQSLLQCRGGSPRILRDAMRHRWWGRMWSVGPRAGRGRWQ